MKKVFISILLFYYTLHFLIPGTYYLINGYVNIYSDVYDTNATLKGFYLNTFMILGAIAIIMFLPDKKYKIEPRFYNLSKLFYLALGFSIGLYILKGGFSGAISGSMSGSGMSYIDLFLKSNAILVAILFYQQRKTRPALLFIVYLIYTMVMGSRSGVISMFVIFLIYPLFENYSRYKQQLKRVLLLMMIISPVLFFVATVFIRKADLGIGTDVILNQIAGRMSFLETSMLPIHYKENGTLNLDLFYAKYSPFHQLEMMIDALIPGNVFEPDIMPNQYYRVLFLGYSEDFVQNVYTSINLTLPVYLYMYFNEFVTVVVAISVLLFYYFLCYRFYNKPYILLPLLLGLYHLLYFFDLVMWFLIIFPSMLTMLTIYGYSIFRKGIVDYFKVKTKLIVKN